MRVEIRQTEVLIHLTMSEAEHVRDDMEADEFEEMAVKINAQMPDPSTPDDDWEPNEDDEDGELDDDVFEDTK